MFFSSTVAVGLSTLPSTWIQYSATSCGSSTNACMKERWLCLLGMEQAAAAAVAEGSSRLPNMSHLVHRITDARECC